METQSVSDVLVHYLLFEGKARCAIAITTETTREAQKRHNLDPLATIAFGRAVSCVALLASILKQSNEFVHGTFAGNGPMQKVIAECNGDGDCRGYVLVPRLVEVLQDGDDIPESVGEALGQEGIVTMTRGLPGEATPYTAVSQFMNGEIASDVARYLTESEQIPSAVAAGVKLSSDAEVLGAGGVLVQRLGGAQLEEEIVQELEKKIGLQLNISERIAAGDSVEKIANFIDGDNLQASLLTSRPLRFKCSCSRERMANGLFALGEKELREIKAETGKIEVRCHYCSATHLFKLEELVPH